MNGFSGAKKNIANWFNNVKKNTVLGIDIGEQTIKLLELSKLGTDYRIESYAIVSLPQGSVVDNNFIDTDNIANVIKEAITQSGTQVKQACVAVTRSMVITKTIPIPRYLTENEIEDYVLAEAEQHIPYPIEKINYDFEIQQTTVDNPETIDVLFVASRQAYIDSRIKVLQKADLITKSINVESFIIENVLSLLVAQLPAGNNNKAIAVIDVGATTLTLNVFYECQIIYTKEQNFGGKELTSQIQNVYDLSYAEAESAKKQGNLPTDYTSHILEPFKQSTVRQITHLLHFFNHSDVHRKIDSIILIGGCLAITGLEKLIEQALEIPTFSSHSLDKHTNHNTRVDTGKVAEHKSDVATHILYPLPRMRLSNRANQQNLSKDASLMVTACGLALSGLD